MIHLVSQKKPHSTAQIRLSLGLREFTPLEIESLVLLEDDPVITPHETSPKPAASIPNAASCTATVYSEDLGQGQDFEGVTVINPFL